ncbi:MAG TPA: ribosome small subunit-dependent GTPase A [Clostridiaceae bacterium]|jgi:ribosome biogenesis GTPase|nr:ribosome small subunit-dependent GTPase A [Clostridiaceae bacterium]
MQGLVIANIADLYKIKTNEKVYEASARGKLKNEGISPVVGDNVEITITDEKNNIARIDKIKERKVYIKRPKLANISKLILVVSSKDPKPDLLMLDKQLAFAEFLGIKSMIVLNKADLDKNKEFENIKRIYENINYKVCITEAKLSKGIEELKRELLNEVSAFSGNSGVGKSTLINHIFESQITEEGEISKKNKRGKNTTTSSFLYTIDNNTYLADTPGFSTFGIDEIESKNLAKYFVEFDEFSKECEFIGCSHIKEECCNIKKAVETGKISKSRYENYCKIYEELRKKELRKW